MKHSMIGVAALVVLFSTAYAEAGWTTLDPPGAISTVAYGIDASEIVGFYADGSWNSHGFLYDGVSWTTLDAPGATHTRAHGIDGGKIVGWYSDQTTTHGFLYDGVSWTTLDAPGANATYPYGMDGSNVVGWYHAVGSGTWHGFLYDGEPAVIPAPGALLLGGIGLSFSGWLLRRRRASQ